MGNIQNRETYIDAVAGLLIIHMIYVHSIQWARLSDTDSAYLFLQKSLGFFMLWFCFKAGMYFKSKDFKTLFYSSLQRLLVPFIVFSLIGYFTWSTKIILEGGADWKQFVYSPVKQVLFGGAIGGNLPLWYLSTLFVARLLFNWILQNKYRWFFIIVFALIPFAIRSLEINIPLYVSNISMAVFFMGLGYFLKPWIENKWVCTVSALVYVLLIVLQPTYVDMRSNGLLYGNYYTWYLTALAGIITLNAFFRIIPFKMSVLSYIGKNSMAFFCLHWIIFTLCSISFMLIGANNLNYSFVIVGLLSCLIVIPLINEVLRKHNYLWILGEKRNRQLNIN